MTATLPVEVWVPVPLRWRHVIAGDVFGGADSRLWHVTKIGPTTTGGIGVVVVQADTVFGDEVDPDDVINVLVPMTERDAVELSMDELGARLVERRTDQG